MKALNQPIRTEHLRVSPHIGILMNRVDDQYNKSPFPELNNTKHTVLVAVTSDAAGIKQWAVQAHAYICT